MQSSLQANRVAHHLGASALEIIIPVQNEAQTLPTLLQDLLLEGFTPAQILVVDDASSDGSGDIARNMGIRVAVHANPTGYGGALKTGLRETTAERIALIDGDGTYAPRDLRTLQDSSVAGSMVVGARIREPSWLRRMVKALFRLQVFLLTGIAVADLNSGLRVFDRKLARDLSHVLPNRFSFTTTLPLGALALGVPVKFVPVGYTRRVGTASKFKVRDAFLLASKVIVGCDWIRRGHVDVAQSRSTSGNLRWVGSVAACIVLATLLPSSGMSQLFFPAALGMAAYVPFVAAKVIRWRRLLAARGVHLSWREAWDATIWGFALGAVTPGRVGELMRIAGPARLGHPARVLLTASILDRLLDLAVVMAVALACLFDPPGASWILLIAVLGVGSVTAAWLFFPLACSLAQRFGLAAVSETRRPTGASILEAAGWTALSMSIFFAIATALLAASGAQGNIPVLAGAVAVGNLAALLPLSVGGLGTRESAVVAFLAAAGTSGTPGMAAAYGLAFHLVFTATPWILMLVGMAATSVIPKLRQVTS